MSTEPTEPATPAMTPERAKAVANMSGTAKVAVDSMPADRTLLRTMPVEQRTAIYLNQIRKMLIFFVILTVIGIVAGVVIGIVDINAVHASQNAGGTGLGY